MEEENIDKYAKIENSELKRDIFKKGFSYMSKFSQDKDLSQDNSNLKFNQINTIPKYGLIYFYNESGIYFLDNSKIKEFFEDKDLSLSNLFFLKCQNIFKIFTIEENDKIYSIICIKNENSFLIYIDLEKIIEKINIQKIIYDNKKEEELRIEENNFESGLVKRQIPELDKNVELNEDGEYGEEVEWEVKKETLEEKKKKFEEKKEKILKERDDIFIQSYENPVKYDADKIIYIENFKDIIIIDKEQYIVLFENGNIIFYQNYEKIRIIEKNAQLMSYNKETSIFLIVSVDYVYILKERDNFSSLKEINKIPIKDILSDEKNELIIFNENILNYIVLYTKENSEEPQNDDKLYFIKLDEDMQNVIAIYFEKGYFYPDDYELDGIAYYSQSKRTVFSYYDKDLGIYMIFNKHMDKLDKYYIFKEEEGNKNLYDLYYLSMDDFNQLNSRKEERKKEKQEEKEEEEDEEEENEYFTKLKAQNPFIGMALIKFKFDGYDNDKEFINGEEMNTPYLIVVLGFYGGFKIFYAPNQQKQLEEKNENFKLAHNISNKVLEISLNEEIIEIEKERYINENNKKQKNFTELNNLKKLNSRNIFLHGLDQQIRENLEYFEKLAVPQTIKYELMNLSKISKNPKILEIQNTMDNLLKEAKELFLNEEENQYFIERNKEFIEKYKNIEINLKNDIKIIQENKNKSKDLKLSLNTPINELLTHQKIKNFFNEDKITNMINIFDKIKNYYNLYENHTNLIGQIFLINEDLIKKIEECKKEYNAIKSKFNYLNNRKDVEDIKKQLQNNIFISYMRIFEQYYNNLEQMKKNYLNKEYLYLGQLKSNYLKSEEQLNNEEEEKKDDESNISNSRSSHGRRFILKEEEEDIDEGNNNNSISSQELEEEINLNSSNKKNKITIYNNRINNNDNNNIDNNNNNNLIVQRNQFDNQIASNNFNNNDNYLVNKETNDVIKKIFGTNLVKEREITNNNYLINILSNFEGRITLYNEESEDNYCTDADDLFKEFLEDEEEIKNKNLKEKKMKEIKEKEKNIIIKNFEESINRQKEDKKKIEKELSEIDEKNKREILEKEKENEILKQKIEELEKKFEENKKEREKEKNQLLAEIEKKKKEEENKILNEQNNINIKIKSLEDEKKNYENKLKEEEKKRIELEEKYKKLEEEKSRNININNNQNITTNVNNVNTGDNQQNNQNNNTNVNNTNVNANTLFTSNKPNLNTSNNIFVQNNQNEGENKDNIEQKKSSIFDSLMGNNAKSLENKIDINQQNTNIFQNAQNNQNNQNNLFKTITSNNNVNKNDIYKTNNNNDNNIFNFGNQNNNQQNNKNDNNNIFNQNKNEQNQSANIFNLSNNNPNQNQNQNQPNQIFGNLNQNNKNQNQSGGIFGSNIIFGSNNQNNSIFGNQPSFGQHTGFGQGNANNQSSTNPITLQFKTSNSSSGNNASPFVTGNSGAGLFNRINQQPQNNSNQDTFF